jgi:hypothetical protein
MPRRFATALPSWVLAACIVAYALVAGNPVWPGAISVAMGSAIVLSFIVQLSLQRKEGLVNRLAFTASGSLVIGAIGIVVALALHGIG